MIWIEARKIIWGVNGKVQCRGRNGGNAGVNGGGGGGGAGGFLQILYAEKEGNATLEVNGGTGGTGNGTGYAGGAGANGLKCEFQVA